VSNDSVGSDLATILQQYVPHKQTCRFVGSLHSKKGRDAVSTQVIRTVFFDLGDTLVAVPKVWLPGAKTLVSALSQKGFHLGIISNTTGLPDRQAILQLLPDDFEIGLFEAPLILFSSEVGMEKPTSRFLKRPSFSQTSQQPNACSARTISWKR
jgi:hypothetical protein